MTTNKNLWAYTTFGLTLHSEIILPELLESHDLNCNADVKIRNGHLDRLWNDLSAGQRHFIVKENFVLFKIDETAYFCVRNGNEIIVSPMKGSDRDKIRLYILGTCMGAILLQRKILPLHGSAVAINGKAYAFIGESGAGKSTLASILLKKGYRLLSDDVIAIYLDEKDKPIVMPSYPQQKLWEESLSHIGKAKDRYRPLFEREMKYAVPVTQSYHSTNLPLCGVFELVKAEGQTVEIKTIENLQQLHTLYTHTYRNFLIQRLGMMEWHFNRVTRLIKHINMFQISRPSDMFTADEIAEKCLIELKGGMVANET